MASRLKKWRAAFFPALCLASFLIVGCGKSKGPPPAKTEEAKQQASPIMSPDEPPARPTAWCYRRILAVAPATWMRW